MVEPLRSFFDYLGHVMAGFMLLVGLWLQYKLLARPNPVTPKDPAVSRNQTWLLLLDPTRCAFASLDQVIVGNEALAVKYDGNDLPAFTTVKESNGDLGIEEPNLRDLIPDYRTRTKMRTFSCSCSLAIRADVGHHHGPWTENRLEESDYDGLGTVLYDQEKPEQPMFVISTEWERKEAQGCG